MAPVKAPAASRRRKAAEPEVEETNASTPVEDDEESEDGEDGKESKDSDDDAAGFVVSTAEDDAPVQQVMTAGATATP